MDKQFDVLLLEPEIGSRVRIIKDIDDYDKFIGITGTIVTSRSWSWNTAAGQPQILWGLVLDLTPEQFANLWGNSLDGFLSEARGRWETTECLEVIY